MSQSLRTAAAPLGHLRPIKYVNWNGLWLAIHILDDAPARLAGSLRGISRFADTYGAQVSHYIRTAWPPRSETGVLQGGNVACAPADAEPLFLEALSGYARLRQKFSCALACRCSARDGRGRKPGRAALAPGARGLLKSLRWTTYPCSPRLFTWVVFYAARHACSISFQRLGIEPGRLGVGRSSTAG